MVDGAHRLAVQVTGVALALSFVVVLLGAWTRLADAGLGCPDWPGCYGHLMVPDEQHEIALANERFPDAPFEAHKAWPEMVHRYAATSLGVLGLVLAALAWRAGPGSGMPRGLMFGFLALVIVQGAFGAFTVTLKLWPQVVTAHLLGGFATASLLWLLLVRLRHGDGWRRPESPGIRLKGLARASLVLVVLQVALGGWTTSNYAALACPDLPTCQTQWLPPMDFAQGFDVLQSVGPNYLGGTLDNDARVAIHFAHRLGAVLVLIAVLALAAGLLRQTDPSLRRLGLLVAGAVCLQFGLGITNVLMTIPMAVAIAHNGGALLLLLCVLAVNWRLAPRTIQPLR